MSKRHNTPLESFRAKTSKTDGCWLWTGATTPFGHGVIRVEGKNQYAHRYSWELHNGFIPDGLNICHKCDIPPCVNPDHLFLGTQKNNIDDMYVKNRASIGILHGQAILTEEQVLEIRRMQGIITQRELAAAYGVTRAAISGIHTRRLWKHI
jgi:hypothetical protein